MDELVVAIKVTTEGVEEALEGVKQGLQQLEEGAKNIPGGNGSDPFKPMSDGAEKAAAAQAALAAASATAFATISKAVQSGTDAYNAYVSATAGLESVANGKGIATDALTDSLDEVTDAFFSATAAAQAYKNLLSRGYSLDQATTTIERLKDAAAFGRAANLSLEDAVVSATEGIKNENSVLVDNAGVTKNVAKMWEEYAKARGLTTSSLTQAQKVEAEYLGIIQETELQVGDLAKASDTLAGAQAENAAEANKLATAYGEAMAPAMQLITGISTELIESVRSIVSAAPALTSGLTAAATAMVLYSTVTKAAAAASALFATGAATIMGPLAVVAAIIGVGTTAYTAYQKVQEETAKTQEEAVKAAQEEQRALEEKAQALIDQTEELEKLGEEYKKLSENEERTELQNKRLETIIDELVTKYGMSETALRSLAGEYDSGNDAIQDRITMYQEERKAILEKQKAEKQALLDQKASENYDRASLMAQLITGGKPNFENEINWIRDEFGNLFDDTGWKTELDNWLAGFYGKAPEVLQAAQEIHDALYNAQSAEEAKQAYYAYFNGLKAQSEEAAQEIQGLTEDIETLNEQIETAVGTEVDRTYDGSKTGTDGANGTGKVTLENAEATTETYKEQLDTAVELNRLLEAIAVLQDENATNAEKYAAALELQKAGYGYLLDNQQAITQTQTLLLEQATALQGTYEEQRAALEAQKEALGEAYASGQISHEEYLAQVAELNAVLEQSVTDAISAAKAMEKLGDGVDDSGDELAQLQKQAQKTGKQLENALNFKAEIRQMKELAKQTKDSGGSWDDLGDDVKSAASKMGVAEGDLDGVISALEAMETQTDTSAAGMVTELQGILATLESLRAEILAIPEAELTADNTQALASINAVISLINALLALAGQAGISLDGSSSKKSGGGGGSGGSSKADTSAADAARDAERAQEEAYQAAIEAIEHKRHLNQITAQEEIAELERVKREYAQTADQIMDIDERIYDARQALREEEEDKITTLYDSIVDALEERYEEQRKIEQRRISDSIAAWEKWSDDTCAAIQAQIDALDEQVEAEDRAATEAEHMRKIDSLQQALVYETDEYNQAQLIKQIEQAQEAWADVQKGWAVEDQRKALEEQMQAVQDQADAEIEALEEEADRIDEVYDEMLKEQSLAAEAQKLLMESTQEDLLSLLSSYAPDYEATGRSLGEKIYEGFVSAFGDISAFFDDLDAQFEALAEKSGNAAFGTTQTYQETGQATANVTSPTINQTVNFNQPVETAADVTRRMQQVNEELAGMI